MKVPLTWLREYCDSGLSAVDLADRLALTGTEVERVSRAGAPSADNFVIGHVLEVEQHPDADRLKVCKVDIGAGEPSTIVCGAPNVAAGQTVAVALPGATMPGGDTLKKAKLRGVESNGMILAEDEIEIGGDHTGIMELDANGTKPGTALTELVQPGDDVLELEITPNRPDCLGVHGIAREVHALSGAPLQPLPDDVEAEGNETFSIEVEDHDDCPRFTARLFDNVTVGPSPLWLKQRLSAAGQRPINNVVDITNYVMLLTSQPMHAFDRDKIRGEKLVVRRAKAGEQMITLDDVEREFDEQMVLVCDAEGPSGIAGIMGGQVSEVSATTTRVLLEVATWNGPNIHRTSQRLALRSEASSRFEKGLSPELPIVAQAVASRLMVELCGAKLVSPTIDVAAEIAAPDAIELRASRVTGLLGTDIELSECEAILTQLGFSVEPAGEQALAVTPPYFRAADVRREADLIEEIARIHGVDNLPSVLPARRGAVGRLSGAQKLKRRVEDLCSNRGFNEAITWSFIGQDALDAMSATGGVDSSGLLKIANPLSEDQSIMRPSALPGLGAAAQHNVARGATTVRLFELGHVYAGTPDQHIEHDALSVFVSGAVADAGWSTPATQSGFFAVKSLLEAVFEVARVRLSVGSAGDAAASQALPDYLHPAKSALVYAGEDQIAIGSIGELHPSALDRLDLKDGTVFEIDFDALAALQADTVLYETVSPFPPAREDLAVVIAETVAAVTVESAIRAGGGDLLTAVQLFDVYTGEQVPAGHVSLAFSLEFSAADRTLEESEVAEQRAAITAALAGIGGELRG